MQKIKQSHLTFIVKILIGVLSFWIIYNRLTSLPNLKVDFLFLFTKPSVYCALLLVLFLMPINWGIESYKWKCITMQTELVSYLTALKSVFSGICVGNIAPGRALEFAAKIIFFKQENRPTIAVLHFINGMFQMLITVAVGILSITIKLNQNNQSNTIIYFALAAGIAVICFFLWAINNVTIIQKKIKFIKWFQKMSQVADIKLSKALILKLISLSIVRYLVFTSQFYIMYNALLPQNQLVDIFISIAAYFMLTSLIPMISVIEPAIRAAIALFVFNNTGSDSIIIVLSSTFVWLINVVVPSVIGYIIILKEKIDFKFSRAS